MTTQTAAPLPGCLADDSTGVTDVVTGHPDHGGPATGEPATSCRLHLQEDPA